MDKNLNTTNKSADTVLHSGNDGNREKSMKNRGLYVCMHVSSLKVKVKLLYKYRDCGIMGYNAV